MARACFRSGRLPLRPLLSSPTRRPPDRRSSPAAGFSVTVLVLATVLSGCASGPGTLSREDGEAGDAGLDVPVVEQAEPRVSDLSVEVGCAEDDPRTGFADIGWSARPDLLERQRLDVTIYKDGFERGYFVVLPLGRTDDGFLHARPGQEMQEQPYGRALRLRVTDVGRPERQAAVSVRVEGLDAGLEYFWRVLTRTETGWVPSPIVRRSAPTCVADYQRQGG